MNVLLYLSLREIEKRVNQSFGEILFEGDKPDGGGMFSEVTVHKLSPIIIHAIEGSLLSTTSVHVDLNMKVQEAGFLDLLQDISGFQRLSFELKITIETQLLISSEGSLQAQSSAQYQWQKKPRLGISILKVNIAGIVQPILEKQLAAVAKEVDQYIEEEIQLEYWVKEAWNTLQQTICIDEAFPAWLTIPAIGGPIGISDWIYGKERLGIALKLPIQVQSFLGEKPTTIPAKPLPILSPMQEQIDQTLFSIDGVIPYTGLAAFMREKEFVSSDTQNSVFIQEIEFSKQEDRLLSVASFTGKFRWKRLGRKIKGVCRLSAKLTLRPDAGIPQLTEIEYKLEKASVINRILNRFLYAKISTYLQASLNEALAEEWKRVSQEVKQGLKKYAIHKHVIIKGKVQQFDLQDLQLEEREIRFEILQKWKAELWLQDLDKV